MNLIDQYRLLIGGYLGVREMDEYDLKVYVLQDIEEYIEKFMIQNPVDNFNYQEEMEKLDNLPLKTKLQDALIVLNKMSASMELILMIKKRLKQINDEELTIYL